MHYTTQISPLVREMELKHNPIIIRVNKFDEDSAKEFSMKIALAHNTGPQHDRHAHRYKRSKGSDNLCNWIADWQYRRSPGNGRVPNDIRLQLSKRWHTNRNCRARHVRVARDR